MNYSETALCFPCAGETLVGILAAPKASAETGIVIIVGGPQYRVGSHRQFVHIARALASAGYAVLRMDYRGMGDSEGNQRDFQAVDDDIKSGIDTLFKQVPTLKKVALWGLCDAASAALLYLHRSADLRVHGLCLLNPWVRSEASHASTQIKHYYAQRLQEKEFWAKLLRGKVALGAANELLRTIRTVFSRTKTNNAIVDDKPYQTQMAVALHRFQGSILLILSGNDLTAKEFLEYTTRDASWSGLLDRPGLVRQDLPSADHTFSDSAHQLEVELLCTKWLGTNPAFSAESGRHNDA